MKNIAKTVDRKRVKYYEKSNEYEMAYARPGTDDDFGEYSYLYTECGNWWYSVNTNPMRRDGCICPKCGKTVRVVVPK